ncbi:3'(2'),5'-bisphosphate nucleotidase [Capronia epimyces CBS 606.96]|uniref:3'(2'),5'-bisphosphate nucleotidase n=1 Tax=Capronia epimyces CBS 606.96 TaxID=1182542 RepID=W9Y407_9EURO|nr:3'(2'),5'-bisphosphate nucleotidase [Capronia epimyces CBS 606.96]EXJ87552.1 3'(2'),5'-bisphosphate nucleotidase [Capronia epimyces CBS 606.96]
MADNPPYSEELSIALLTVQRASLLTKRIVTALDKGVIDKSDASPVTIADFAAQALIISALHRHFPSDGFIGEESAGALRENPELGDRVWELVSTTTLEDADSEELLGRVTSKEEMLQVIDLGAGSQSSSGRTWILDPVDGTATFMRNQQYVVCLALVEGGRQILGVLGCPNLLINDAGQVREDLIDTTGLGQMLSAVDGQGAYIRPIARGRVEPPTRLRKVTEVTDPAKIRWVDSLASSNITPQNHRAVAEKVGSSGWPGTDIWAMQMKYVALAVGAFDAMVRIPPDRSYRASVWDHAGGQLIYTEVGGVVLDTSGQVFDFGLGRSLEKNLGLVAAPPSIHPKLLAAAKEVLATPGDIDRIDERKENEILVSGA